MGGETGASSKRIFFSGPLQSMSCSALGGGHAWIFFFTSHSTGRLKLFHLYSGSCSYLPGASGGGGGGGVEKFISIELLICGGGMAGIGGGCILCCKRGDWTAGTGRGGGGVLIGFKHLMNSLMLNPSSGFLLPPITSICLF